MKKVVISLLLIFSTAVLVMGQTRLVPARSRAKLADQPKWPINVRLTPVSVSGFRDDDKELRELFDQAMEAIRAGKFNDALEALKAAEKLGPKVYEVQMALGYVLYRLGRPEDAASAYGKAADIKSGSAAAHGSLCSIFVEIDKPIEAADHCREAVRLAPDEPEYRAMLARLYLLDGRSADALQLLEEIYLKRQNDLQLAGILGDSYVETGEYQKAAAVYERIAQMWPTANLVYLRLSTVYDYLDRATDSIASARKYAEVEPKQAYAHLNLGEKLKNAGFFDESLPPLLTATTLDPAFGYAYLALADSYQALGDKENTVGSLRHAYKYVPPDLDISYRLGSALTGYGRMAEAVEPLERANTLEPNNYAIMSKLGVAYFESNQFDKAITILTKADELKPNNQVIEMFLRVAKTRKNMLEHFDDVLEEVRANPNDALLHNKLASAYRYRGLLKDAEREHREAIRIAPTDDKNYSWLAIFFGDTGQTEKSVEPFQKAAEMSQTHIAYLNLSDTFAKLGRLDEAVAAAKRGVEIKPDSIELRLQYGDMLIKKGNRIDAQREFQAAFEVASGDPRPNFRLAWLYIRAGNKEGALRHYAILKSIAPGEVANLEKSIRAHFGPIR